MKSDGLWLQYTQARGIRNLSNHSKFDARVAELGLSTLLAYTSPIFHVRFSKMSMAMLAPLLSE